MTAACTGAAPLSALEKHLAAHRSDGGGRAAAVVVAADRSECGALVAPARHGAARTDIDARACSMGFNSGTGDWTGLVGG
jgi:hypothetical protein